MDEHRFVKAFQRLGAVVALPLLFFASVQIKGFDDLPEAPHRPVAVVSGAEEPQLISGAQLPQHKL